MSCFVDFAANTRFRQNKIRFNHFSKVHFSICSAKIGYDNTLSLERYADEKSFLILSTNDQLLGKNKVMLKQIDMPCSVTDGCKRKSVMEQHSFGDFKTVSSNHSCTKM